MEIDVFFYIFNVVIFVVKEKVIIECIRYFYNLKQVGINVVVINLFGGMLQYINVYNLMYLLVVIFYLLNILEMYMLIDLLELVGIMVVVLVGNNSWSIDQVIYEWVYFLVLFINKNVILVVGINNQGEFWSGFSYGCWFVDLVVLGQDILSMVLIVFYFDVFNLDFIVIYGIF